MLQKNKTCKMWEIFACHHAILITFSKATETSGWKGNPGAGFGVGSQGTDASFSERWVDVKCSDDEATRVTSKLCSARCQSFLRKERKNVYKPVTAVTVHTSGAAGQISPLHTRHGWVGEKADVRQAAQKGKRWAAVCSAHSWILFDGGSLKFLKELFFPVLFTREIHFHLK